MKYNKKDFEQLFMEIGIESTDDMFVLEPETTMKKLQELEKRFNINTKTALKINDIIGEQDEIFSEWTTLFYEYEAYDGNVEKLNTVSNAKENESLRLRNGLVPVENAVNSVLHWSDTDNSGFVSKKIFNEKERGLFSPLLFLLQFLLPSYLLVDGKDILS